MSQARANGFDRFNDALKSLDEQLQEVREGFEERRKRFETELKKRRESIETRVRKTELFKHAERVRRDVEEQVESSRSQLYDAFGIASKSEIDKLHKKLNTISRKLNELSREHAQAS